MINRRCFFFGCCWNASWPVWDVMRCYLHCALMTWFSLVRSSIWAGWSTVRSWWGVVVTTAASSLVRDLVVLRNLDGLFDSFEIDAYHSRLVAWNSILRRGYTVLWWWNSVGRADASMATDATWGRALFFFQQNLANLFQESWVHRCTFGGLISWRDGRVAPSTSGQSSTQE